MFAFLCVRRLCPAAIVVLTLLFARLCAAGPAGAPAMNMSGSSSPAMSMPQMPSSVDLSDPMSREGSGTSWLPDSTPMYGKMIMKPDGQMIMLHGAIMPRYTDVGSKRGDRKADAPNWFMGMYSRPLDSQSQFGAHLMMSLDPLTEGGYGYPLLFQTGESWHHVPLHDRQHPHDFFAELSGIYSRRFSGTSSAYLYLADPGEPALGPPAYMHRLIALDLPDAPIGHHWQDATHITYGVVTAGLALSEKIKFEASDFTGREPDENRWNFDKPRWDSYSGRVSFNPNSDNAFQVSYGFIKDPEGDGANVDRTTASWIYNRPLGDDSNFTTSLVWGQNFLTSEGKSESYLLEADYQNGANSWFTRYENIQKSGHELVLPTPYDNAILYDLNALTVGCVHDLSQGKGIDTGIGLAVTVDVKPSDLDPFYGHGAPVGFEVYLRLRPSRMDMAATSDTQPQASSPQAGAIQVILSPNPPTAGTPATITLKITGPDGAPIAGAKVDGTLQMVGMDMGTKTVAFEEVGEGIYQGKATFAMAGSWNLNVIAMPPGGERITATIGCNVGS